MNLAAKKDRAASASRWRPALGAWCEGGGIHFRVWAPTRRRVQVVIEGPGKTRGSHEMVRAADGTFSAFVAEAGAGSLYRYRLDGEGPFPDPASRFQPRGVHGPSQVVAPQSFRWSDASWTGVEAEELVLYELHVGTFTPAGTFAALSRKLAYLRDLGVTALEIMPVADFPGDRNWGYDGVALFAPARCYGQPDDLRRLVDRAHRLGLAVFLDVVYNHLGPDGNYLALFSPFYFSKRHQTPWGDGVNLDGPNSGPVRDFFIENALHWVHEYRVDGLRLDATHALLDDSPRHFLAELSARVHASVRERRVLVVAEDHRNLAHMVRPEEEGGWGLDAVWADDFHHQVRRGLAGDSEGYFRDFTGSVEDLTTTLRRGWFFCGQHSQHEEGPRGTDPSGLPPDKFVICIQNHDQVGNRAFGERLHQQIDPAAYRAATTLLLLAPQIPLLFMGQEWAVTTPFLYFTDHNSELGRLVTEGRRREFRHFAAFRDPANRARIPDPQSRRTFTASKLPWPEQEEREHASVLRLYRALLDLRQSQPALGAAAQPTGFDVRVLGDGALRLQRSEPGGAVVAAAVQWRGSGHVVIRRLESGRPETENGGWRVLLHTEEARFAIDPQPPVIDLSAEFPSIRFRRPGAVVLRRQSRVR